MPTHHSRDSDSSEDEPEHDAEDIQDKDGLPLDLRFGEHEETYGEGNEDRREDGFEDIDDGVELSL